MKRRRIIADDLEALLDTLPPRVVAPLRQRADLRELLEVVLDLGRPPEARFPSEELILDPEEVDEQDLQYVIDRIGEFGEDNRAGIPRTLHRISAIRNRKGKVVGLTCRVGRAVFGTIDIIEDLVFSGKNILLLGRPGVGKTTMLREAARVCRPDGRIVLLEHVRSPVWPIALLQRLWAPIQERTLSCDLLRTTIDTARGLGFTVESERERLFGVFRLAIARPPDLK